MTRGRTESLLLPLSWIGLQGRPPGAGHSRSAAVSTERERLCCRLLPVPQPLPFGGALQRACGEPRYVQSGLSIGKAFHTCPLSYKPFSRIPKGDLPGAPTEPQLCSETWDWTWEVSGTHVKKQIDHHLHVSICLHWALWGKLQREGLLRSSRDHGGASSAPGLTSRTQEGRVPQDRR